MPPITIQQLEAEALEKIYLASAGRMLAQILAISNAPNSQMQRILKRLDDEADKLAEDGDRITPDNPQLEQTLNEYENTMNTTQALILANDNDIQEAALKLVVPAITAKVFTILTAYLIARNISPFSQQAVKYFSTQTVAKGIPWVMPSAADFAADYVGSTTWISRMEKWGKGYADLTRDTILKGVQEGWGPKYTASQMRRHAQNLPKSAAESLTRTLQLTSYRDASAEMELMNNKYITGKIRISALKQTTCLTCISLHGTPLAVGERVNDHYRGFCSEFYQVPGGPQYPEMMQADSTPGNRNFVPFQTGEEWFANLPPERQEQQASFLKSPAKLRAYRDGTPLSVFQGDHVDSVFGAQTVERSLKDAIGLKNAQGYYSINQAKPDIPAPVVKETTVDEWVSSLSDEQVDAFYSHYTKGDYELINGALRNGDTSGEYVKLIDTAIESAPKLDDGLNLYRGIQNQDLADSLKSGAIGIGDEIADAGYMSTSNKLTVAQQFAGRGLDGDSILYNITTKGRSTGAIMVPGKLGYGAKEGEIVLPRGSVLRVVNIKKIIHEEIGLYDEWTEIIVDVIYE